MTDTVIHIPQPIVLLLSLAIFTFSVAIFSAAAVILAWLVIRKGKIKKLKMTVRSLEIEMADDPQPPEPPRIHAVVQ